VRSLAGALNDRPLDAHIMNPMIAAIERDIDKSAVDAVSAR
jgi:hypothetical protein